MPHSAGQNPVSVRGQADGPGSPGRLGGLQICSGVNIGKRTHSPSLQTNVMQGLQSVVQPISCGLSVVQPEGSIVVLGICKEKSLMAIVVGWPLSWFLSQPKSKAAIINPAKGMYLCMFFITISPKFWSQKSAHMSDYAIANPTYSQPLTR